MTMGLWFMNRYKLLEFMRFLKHYALNKAMYKNYFLFRKQDKNKKVRILIIAQLPEVWNSVKTVYETAVNHEDIDLKILAIPKFKSPTDRSFQGNPEKNEMYDFLNSLGIDCINAYDCLQGKWVSIQSLTPHYVIYTRSYNDQIPAIYGSNIVCSIAKTCYIPYAYNMMDNEFRITFNANFLTYINYTFVASRSRLDMCKREYYFQNKLGISQFIYLGFPRFDLLSQDTAVNSHYTIAWLPRWTSEKDGKENKKSHFFEYYMKFIEWAGRHKEVEIIIRPHPLMFDNFIDSGIMSIEKVEEFKNKCRLSDSIYIDKDKDYMPLLRKADVLIADYTSLLIEYFVTGKPIIYCDNADNLSQEALIMDAALYHAKSFMDITNILSDLYKGNDIKREERENAILELLPKSKDGKSAGQTIVEFILNDFMNL